MVPATTKLREMPRHVRLHAREGGAPKACVLKCEQIMTVPRADLRPEALGAPLDPERMRLVEAAILRAIGIPIPLDR